MYTRESVLIKDNRFDNSLGPNLKDKIHPQNEPYLFFQMYFSSFFMKRWNEILQSSMVKITQAGKSKSFMTSHITRIRHFAIKYGLMIFGISTLYSCLIYYLVWHYFYFVSIVLWMVKTILSTRLIQFIENGFRIGPLLMVH